MSTFFMFGKYSSEAVKEVSAERTSKATSLMERFGGRVNSMYALLGEHDLVRCPCSPPQLLLFQFSNQPCNILSKFSYCLQSFIIF